MKTSGGKPPLNQWQPSSDKTTAIILSRVKESRERIQPKTLKLKEGKTQNNRLGSTSKLSELLHISDTSGDG